jgi:hypothetical protein
MVTRMQFRFVFTFVTPPSATHRDKYQRNIRAYVASRIGKGIRVVRPLRLRWANGSRVLVADYTLEDATFG